MVPLECHGDLGHINRHETFTVVMVIPLQIMYCYAITLANEGSGVGVSLKVGDKY